MYDYAIIGAGINGCFMAYRLKLAGKKVVLLDPKGVGGSGSQAAGAFLSPKVGKGGDLKALVNEAYKTAIAFYAKEVPELFTQKGLLHFPKDLEDAQNNFPDFKKFSDNAFTSPLADHIRPLKEKTIASEGLFFSDAGVVEPLELCHYLTQEIECINQKVENASWQGESWDTKFCQAKNLILASGAYPLAVKADYIKLRAVWGERIEVTSETKVPINYHQNISISATKDSGKIVIGASHKQHQMDKALDPNEAQLLLDKANKIMDLKETSIIDHRGGVRAGSFDYLPMVGPIVDTLATLDKFPKLIKGTKVDEKLLCYYPNVYIINGVGGRGFVLAPYLSQCLTDALLNNKDIDKRITTQRLFKRWVKKQIKEQKV